MTVHQALSKIKILNKRLPELIEKFKPVTKIRRNETKVNGVDKETVEKNIVSDYQQIIDLQNQLCALKGAISKYNAETMVTVCGKTMTIAEAIWQNQYGIQYKKNLLGTISRNYIRTQEFIEAENGDKLDRRVNQYASAFTTTDETTAKAVEQFRANNEMTMIDPIGIEKVISKMTTELDEMQSEIDAAIQVANATNTIKVEY
jgi:chaperonin cofactor prefoldin